MENMMRPIWYWLLPLCVLGFALHIGYRNYSWWEHSDSYMDSTDKWIGWAVGGIVTGVFCVFSLGLAEWLSSFIGKNSYQVWHECWRGTMVSLRSADGIQGSIAGGVFLMSGFVESRRTYFYYTLKKDGSFEPGRWTPYSDTSVYEEDRRDGEVVQFEVRFKHGWVLWFAEVTEARLRMDFHIPKGSLQQTFSLQ